jgi:hypothetical protein
MFIVDLRELNQRVFAVTRLSQHGILKGPCELRTGIAMDHYTCSVLQKLGCLLDSVNILRKQLQSSLGEFRSALTLLTCIFSIHKLQFRSGLRISRFEG